eukprot:2656767-Prymnesium_polylepis.1
MLGGLDEVDNRIVQPVAIQKLVCGRIRRELFTCGKGFGNPPVGEPLRLFARQPVVPCAAVVPSNGGPEAREVDVLGSLHRENGAALEPPPKAQRVRLRGGWQYNRLTEATGKELVGSRGQRHHGQEDDREQKAAAGVQQRCESHHFEPVALLALCS